MDTQPRVDVLLVDDNPAKLVALEAMLVPLGENLVAARSGEEALRHLLARRFATIVLDVNMPGMDGFETAQLIRGRPATKHTPIIFVSAINLSDTDALRGYALGAVDYITAPIVPEVLRAKVAVFIELFRKTEEAQRHAEQVEQRTRELEASQQQLRLAERMAAIGTLSAGLGHDMGNLLLPIQLQLDSIRLDQLPAEAASSLRGIGACVTHLRRLASGLRLLALDPDDEAAWGQVTHLDDWWLDASPVLKNVLPRGVEFEHDVPPGLPPVRLAPHLLTQAIYNLVQNAGDALRERGSGRVRVWGRAEPSGSRVRLGVSDDGPGMTPEVRARCLEPFFTTRTRRLSTGLGLALVHGIVQRVGGRLAIDTRPGEGATFSFDLPLCPVPDARSRRAAPRALVTVADPRTRGFLSYILAGAGFETEPADDPARPEAPHLWVADADGSITSRVREFLDAQPGRAVLLFGEPPPSLPPERVAVVPADAPPSVVRQNLGRLAQAVGLAPGPRDPVGVGADASLAGRT